MAGSLAGYRAEDRWSEPEQAGRVRGRAETLFEAWSQAGASRDLEPLSPTSTVRTFGLGPTARLSPKQPRQQAVRTRGGMTRRHRNRPPSAGSYKGPAAHDALASTAPFLLAFLSLRTPQLQLSPSLAFSCSHSHSTRSKWTPSRCANTVVHVDFV